MDDLKSLIPVSYDNPERPTVSGRELHDFLEVKSKYADWFKNMSAYGFTENIDYVSLSKNLENGGRSIDHQLTIPMAKELCMIQRNERGKQARQYFLAVEAQWNSPEGIAFHDSLNGAFCFRTHPYSAFHGIGVFRFGTSFIWWPKIRPLKITARFCALVHKPLHIRRGVPNFGETQSITAFSFAHSIKTNRYALFPCVKMWYNGDINRTLVAPPGLARQFCLTNEPVQI